MNPRGAETEPESHLGSLWPVIEAMQAHQGPALAYSGLRKKGEEWRDWRRKARHILLKELCYSPPKCPFDLEVLDTVQCDGYVRKRVSFATAPHTRVPAYLMVPEGTGQFPGVLALHDHGGYFYSGKEKVVSLPDEHPALIALKKRFYDGLSIADEMARRGYVVLVIDAYYWGERRPNYLHQPSELSQALEGVDPGEAEYVLRINRFLKDRIPSLKTMLAFSGSNWLGIVVHDDLVSLDLLRSLPEVDSARLGAVGLSGGGYRATYLTGVAEGLQAACVVGWMTTLRDIPSIARPVHADLPVVDGLHRYLDYPDIAALGAPECALFVQSCMQDRLFTYSGMEKAMDYLEGVYDDIGAAERYKAKFYDVPHQFNAFMQRESFAWLDRWLK